VYAAVVNEPGKWTALKSNIEDTAGVAGDGLCNWEVVEIVV
jgi:hypothetical protein